MPSIGVAICCYKGHIHHLGKLLDSIQGQSRLPEHVVVSCSSSSVEDIPYQASDYRFPLTILTHSEYKNASQNRNCAAAALTTDIVSFFDADDTMHPQRLQFMDECFANRDIKIFLHNGVIHHSEPFEHYTSYYCLFNVLYRCPWGSTRIHSKLDDVMIFNGHATVRKEVLQDIRFREEAEFHGKEDTVFCGEVITRYPYQTAYCHNKLMNYSRGGTYGFIPV
jgi:glycosyltransferase involved in cell wall biosynthesis